VCHINTARAMRLRWRAAVAARERGPGEHGRRRRPAARSQQYVRATRL